MDNDELEPDDEEASTEASPLEGAGHPVRDGGLLQGDGEVRAQEHAVEDLVHGQALTPIREEGGATSVREASSCNEGPSEGKLETGRASRVAGAAIGRDYEPHSSGDDADGVVVGGGGHDDAGDVEENEVEEVGSNFEAKDVESDLERGFDDIVEEPEQNSVTSDDVVGQSPVANMIDMVRSPMRMGVAPSHSLREVDGREVEEREVGERSSESSESGDSDSSLEEQSDDQAIKGFEDFLSGL